MTYNRTTELLCKMLEERGLSCQTDYLHVVWRVGPKLYDAVDNFDGTLTVDNLTPERTCSNIAEPDEMSDRPFTCSECGARGPYGEGIYHIGGSREVGGNLVFWDSWPVYKFCQNCGAKVVGE